MATPLLVLNLRRKRDVVLARERARQVAGLLGFDAGEQACVAAAVFEIGCQARAQTGLTALQFQVEGTALHVFAVATAAAPPGAPAGLRLEKPLPARDPAVALEDLSWVVRQLAQLAPPDLFAEIRRQNQEVLRLLVELQACRAKLAETSPEGPRPVAA